MVEGLDGDGRPLDVLGGAKTGARRCWVCREVCLIIARDVEGKQEMEDEVEDNSEEDDNEVEQSGELQANVTAKAVEVRADDKEESEAPAFDDAPIVEEAPDVVVELEEANAAEQLAEELEATSDGVEKEDSLENKAEVNGAEDREEV